MMENPFFIRGYKSSEYFCDRDKETCEILKNLQNGADTTLISPRKYGKTGLILHAFDEIAQRRLPFETLYVDIFATLSLDDLVKTLAEAILEKFPERSSIGKKFMGLLRGLRPILSYDLITNQPQVQFNFVNTSEQEHTLKSLLTFLNTQKKQVVLAIDEFQQITEYPEKNIEALLRTYAQQTRNIRFIFCGSKKKIMAEMFLDANRPFFSSTRTLALDKIESAVYGDFIRGWFEKAGIPVEEDALRYILDWTKRHTFYTQSVCNEIFAGEPRKVDIETVNKACLEILERETPNFLQYRAMLTQQQWRILIAVAKEDEVEKITSAEFLMKYKIGSATNSRRAIESLMNKELILENTGLEKTSYQVYNVFFSRWLAKQY
ncbi:MAG: ATP-binding protein [Verrucomicrobia bacterium]|nr:ATP-binding protein [Verrucomicrobiota bacterium]